MPRADRRSKKNEAESLPPVPFVLSKVYSFGSPELCIAVLEVGDGYLGLEYLVGSGYYDTFVVKKHSIGGLQYRVAEAEAYVDNVLRFKAKALQRGATLEAIQLLGTLTSLTKDEELKMAQAGTKLARKDGDKAGLKAAAKAAPVAAKKKGNPEALAKARAARAENTGPDNRKITVLKKDHGARDGTKRADLLNKIYKSKTVQNAVDAGVAKSDVSWAAREGYISVA